MKEAYTTEVRGAKRLSRGLVIAVGLVGALLFGTARMADAAAWQRVWSDEFNAAAGTPPNSSRWVRETGAGGWGNNELQTYTTSTNNARHDGAGNLIIEARRNGSGYTSARLKTQGRFSFTYGRVEVRLAVPKGRGLWPAAWMLGNNIGSIGWPRCGEIDIMEHINTNDTILGTMHWDNGGHRSQGGNTTTSVTGFHTYMVDWNSTSVNWYLDGRQYASARTANNVNGTEEFHRPFFILLNFAVGGNWPGSPTTATSFPSQYKIDYVRVSQFR